MSLICRNIPAYKLAGLSHCPEMRQGQIGSIAKATYADSGYAWGRLCCVAKKKCPDRPGSS